ncbi:MAG: GNAT family N-acetyltransferase [Sedimentisphaerales bacterium]|nr:GNAT family N-acetyltransferase [Sedimentisphaerales bacterium]
MARSPRRPHNKNHPTAPIPPDAVRFPLRPSGRIAPAGNDCIRPAHREEIESALKLLLAPPGKRAADRDAIDAFRRWAREEACSLDSLNVAVDAGRIVHVALFILQAGGSAFAWISPPAAPDVLHLAQRNIQHCCQWAAQQGASLLQVLLEPGDETRSSLCESTGFARLTELIYLGRSITAADATADEPADARCRFVAYSPERHDLFRDTIARTYQDSRDCPELSALRSSDDAIDSHKAVGVFEPQWWHLLEHEGHPVGVVLLNGMRNGQAMELTYMGLCPDGRGRGLGRVLLQKALDTTFAARRHALTLAVDCRNAAALHLYGAFGFTPLLRRLVYLRSIGDPASPPPAP